MFKAMNDIRKRLKEEQLSNPDFAEIEERNLLSVENCIVFSALKFGCNVKFNGLNATFSRNRSIDDREYNASELDDILFS